VPTPPPPAGSPRSSPSRGVVAGLGSPYPLGLQLPALLQDDPTGQALTAALDEVLAPVFWVLDNLDAYLDPHLTPGDFLEWLARWVGVAVDENWPLERRRDLVARAAELYRRRGTIQALREQVALYTGSVPEIEDSGGTASSPVPGGAVPGSPQPRLRVRVVVTDPSTVDLRRLEAMVCEAKPAHIPHEVEVVPG
jgi:phage tail-like protein